MQLIPNALAQFIDSSGAPLASGSVGFYFPGTLNPKATFQDMAGTIANPNPVPLNSRGQALIWGSGVYRQIVKDASGVTIWDQITEDPNAGLTGDITDAKFVAGVDFTPGTTTSLTLPVAPGASTNMWTFFDAAYQADDQVLSLVGTTLTFVAPIPVGVQEVNIKIGTTVAVGVPSGGSVTDATVAAGANIDSSKLSFLQTGAGAVRRTVQSKLRDVVSVMDFGAKGDGVADDTTAIQAAINYVANINGVLYFPPLTFIVSTLSYTGNNNNLTLQGSGKFSTKIKTNAATGDVLTIAGTQCVLEVRDMEFAPTVTRAAGNYINVTATGAGHLFRRVFFALGFNHLSISNSNIYSIEDCDFVSHTGVACTIQNIASPDAGDSNITGCVFNTNTNTAVHIGQYSSGGLRILNNKFLGAGYHYLGQFNTGATSTSILIIEGNSSEAATTTNFALNSTGNTGFSKVVISGNQLSVNAGASGISVQDPGYAWLDDMEIIGNNFAMGGAGGVAMAIARSTRLSMGMNTIVGNNVESGIIIGAGVTSGNIAPQNMTNLATYYANSGTVLFSPGRKENGSVSASTNAAYGSFFVTPVQNVSFAQPYGSVPSVMCTMLNAGGAVGALVSSVTTTGFQVQLFGLTNSTNIQTFWQAEG